MNIIFWDFLHIFFYFQKIFFTINTGAQQARLSVHDGWQGKGVVASSSNASPGTVGGRGRQGHYGEVQVFNIWVTTKHLFFRVTNESRSWGHITT